MATKSQSANTKSSSLTKKNPLETLGEFSGSVAKQTVSEFGKISTGIFDKFFGVDEENVTEENPYQHQDKTISPKKKIEASVFNFSNYHEQVTITREVQALQEEVKKLTKEIKAVVGSGTSDLVKDAGKLSIEPISEKPGIYHERFLQFILNLLKTLRAKVGESRTWLQAFVTKKKKRGSAFLTRRKEKGSLYDQSMELNTARSVQ
ncbi:MAG: hypothetical protein HYW86_03445 [Candidatus Roizmanbacteria bacterium]|nr:MAG: hypothetical protein HYW86_03445 [Candidatus Roizmanbacteria bacterium]